MAVTSRDADAALFWLRLAGPVALMLGPACCLILAVLGSILGGIATPTEAASVGAVGAMVLAVLRWRLSFAILRETVIATATITSMVFVILLGASVFSVVFRMMGGDNLVHEFLSNLPGGALAAVAVGMGVEAIRGLQRGVDRAPTGIALAAAVASIVVKELLYRWTARVGRRVRSPATIANAWHHRSDAISSLPAAVAVGVALIDPEWAVVDRVGAVVVCILILQAAWRILRPALNELVDRGAPAADRRRLEALALDVPGVKSAHALRTRYVGSALSVDLHVEVDGALSVAEGHAIAVKVRQALLDDGPDVADAVVQIEPHGRPEIG